VVGRDTERHNYVRRLSHIAGVIAQEAGLEPDQCETIRRAALLRDIGELDLNREIFRHFSLVCGNEGSQAEGNSEAQHVKLVEVMDLVLANKIYGAKFDRQPVGARILAVATEYDDLTSTKKRRSALPPSVAKSMIEREAGKKFDAGAVRAFSRACEHGAFSGSTQRIGQMA
jgi:HD-GYP domain-containing protein (c-di-GMP phosphodiesterase class II)